jgi:hypothetical protein
VKGAIGRARHLAAACGMSIVVLLAHAGAASARCTSHAGGRDRRGSAERRDARLRITRTAPAGRSTTYVFPAPGTYQVTLTVTDVPGMSASEVTTFVVKAPNPPKAVLAPVTPAAYAGQPVGYDATSSAGADASIATYRWDFGDGAQRTGGTTAHIYASAGTPLAPTPRRGPSSPVGSGPSPPSSPTPAGVRLSPAGRALLAAGSGKLGATFRVSSPSGSRATAAVEMIRPGPARTPSPPPAPDLAPVSGAASPGATRGRRRWSAGGSSRPGSRRPGR